MALPVTFTLTSTATQSNAPFTFGHVFAQGDVPSGQYVNSNLTDWQAVPTTLWPDGSVRHAIIAGRVANTTADVPVAVSLSASGTDRSGAALTEAALTTRLAAIGTTTLVCGAETITLSSLVSTSALHRTVCSGPVMSNWLYRKPLSGSNHLVAWFDVRLYLGGAVEIFPWIENAYLFVASPTNDVRTYTFTMGGTQRFSQSIDVKHHTRVPLLSGATFSYWSADPLITPKHDSAYFIDSMMTPNYGWRNPSETALNQLPTTYTPNTLAGISSSMGAAGTSAGIIQTSQALYVTSGDPRAWRSAIIFGLSGGSWSTHYRYEGGNGVAAAANEPFKFTDWPNISINTQESPTVPMGAGGENGIPGVSHQPSFGYLPWLLTGRWWFLEEQLFWMGFNYISENTAQRRGGLYGQVNPLFTASAGDGLINGESGSYQVRGAAWGLRTVAQSFAILPETHYCYSSVKNCWEQNVRYYRDYYVTGDYDPGVREWWPCPFGLMGEYGNPYGSGDYWGTAGWQHGMLQQVWGFAKDLDLQYTGDTESRVTEVTNHCMKLSVALAGGVPGWNYRRFIVYGLILGNMNTPPHWYSSWSEALTKQEEYVWGGGVGVLGSQSSAPGQSLFQHTSNLDFNSETSSWPWFGQQFASLTYAVSNGLAGADTGWTNITTASNYDDAVIAFNDDPVYGFLPRSTEAPTGGAISGTVGNASAAGLQAAINSSGSNAAISVSYNVAIGVVIYAGRFAPSGGATTINGVVGNAVAAGSSAAVSDGSGPLWLQGLAANQAIEIAGSAPSVLGRINHGGDNNGNWIDPWCGLSIDTRTSRVYAFANGGHLDYLGNEINMLDLLLSVPLWGQLLGQSASCATLASTTNNAAYYPDGRPASVHSYYQQQFIEARDRAARFPTGAVATSGNGKTECASFNILTNTCDPSSPKYLPDAPTTPGAYFGPICKVSDLRTGVETGTEDVYLFNGNNAVYKWAQATNTMSTLVLTGESVWPPNAVGVHPYIASAYDPVRNRILLWSPEPYVFSLANNSFTAVTPTGSAVADLQGSGMGMVYEPVLDRFLIKTGYTANGALKSKLYSVDPATFAATEITVTGAASMPMPQQISGDPHNIFSRFLYVPALSGVVYVPNYQNNAWFIRTH